MEFAVPAMMGVSMMGSLMQGQQAKSEAEQTADLLEYNKAVERENATAVGYATEAEIAKINRQEQHDVSRARAIIGKSGFTMAGSPLAYMNDLVTQYELDKATTQWQGDTQAQKYISQGNIYGMSARAQRTKAKQAMPRALLSGLTSAGSIYASSKARF